MTKTDVGIDMPNFAPLLVPSPYDFQIENDGMGTWIVRERDDRSGGVFFSRKEAMRYALFEAGVILPVFTTNLQPRQHALIE